MTGRFENSYLAESVGYNNGHALGWKQGLDQGHINGWNDAIAKMNPVVDECNANIQRLQAECARLNAENDRLREIGNRATAAADEIHTAGQRVSLHNEQLQELLRMQQEQSHSMRADYESMFTAFKGLASMIDPALRMVAGMDLQQRDNFVTDYAKQARKLLSKEHTDAHGWPHNSPLIKKYAPVSHSVIEQTIAEARERRSAAAAQQASASL